MTSHGYIQCVVASRRLPCLPRPTYVLTVLCNLTLDLHQCLTWDRITSVIRYIGWNNYLPLGLHKCSIVFTRVIRWPAVFVVLVLAMKDKTQVLLRY